MKRNYCLIIGALLGMFAVILGAFGAHGLEKMLDAKMLQRFHTGVEYQFYHAFALLATGLLREHYNHKLLNYAGYAFTLGVLLFSASLYAYAMTGITAIAVITPLGGTAFIMGWLFLLLFLIKK
ncbi:MAG: DUF423 domain-containing protein [Gammaproteobacteria bacterium]|nr:DUF423 domain-containing protein [Gammaproteobacteria bacterium]MBU1724566.1 DUF423 domain-containing protein [Gammaproteobacteria bacterium]MBU2004609.1 DUF423 domain-containing protein [Gammaproteobacteria bacterium]